MELENAFVFHIASEIVRKGYKKKNYLLWYEENIANLYYAIYFSNNSFYFPKK